MFPSLRIFAKARSAVPRLFSSHSLHQAKQLIVGANAIVIQNNKILLGKRLNAIGAGTWGLPAGHIEAGETPSHTASREFQEKTGLRFQSIKLLGYVDGQFLENNTPYQSYFVLGSMESGNPKVCEPEECENWQWFNINKLPTPLFDPISRFLAQNPGILANAEALLVKKQQEGKHTSIPVGKVSFFKTDSQPHLHVLSFDFDKCLYNQVYLSAMHTVLNANPNLTWGEFLEAQNEALSHANKEFLVGIARDVQSSACDTLTLCLGSARQSHQDDWVNRLYGAKISGSAHYALLMLKHQLAFLLQGSGKHISVDIFYLLLADIYSKLNTGTAYKMALNAMHDNFSTWSPQQARRLKATAFSAHPHWVFDESKLTIVYAQIQQLAIDNPLARIHYNFYDDRLDILQNLADFLSANQTTFPIPRHLTVTLNQYMKGKLKKITTIQGEGDVDHGYREKIQRVIALVGGKTNHYDYVNIFNIITEIQHKHRMFELENWCEEQKSLSLSMSGR